MGISQVYVRYWIEVGEKKTILIFYLLAQYIKLERYLLGDRNELLKKH